MKNSLLFPATILTGFLLSHSTTFSVTNSSFTFAPASTTIITGDTVNFTLASIHNVREVSLATYNANGTTALTGGFSVAFGGGKLTGVAVGTHYYVCSNHASMGMKGQIIVQSSVGILGSHVVHVKGPGQFSYHISNKQADSVRMSAEDMMGRVVWEKDFALTNSREVSWNSSGMDGHALPSGMYVVRIRMLGEDNASVGETRQTGTIRH